MGVERMDQTVLASFSGFLERLISVETLEPPADARCPSVPRLTFFPFSAATTSLIVTAN